MGKIGGLSPDKMKDAIEITDAKNSHSSLNEATLGKMREMRKSISFEMKAQFGNTNKSAKSSIQRASVCFQLSKGTEAADIVIENERLKSTLDILNQKLKVSQDNETHAQD